MAITDAQFSAWLREDARARVVLVNLYVYSVADGAEIIRRVSNREYIATLPESPPRKVTYDDLLTGSPTITRQLNQNLVGEADASWGELELDNTDGALDAWLDDYWDGRRIEVLLGDWSWGYADFRSVFTGAIGNILAKDVNTISITVRDRRELLNRPVSADKPWDPNVFSLPSGGYITGTGTANDGEPAPICYGYCYNIEPRLYNDATREFVFHDDIPAIGGGFARVVRDNGLAVAFTKPSGPFITLNQPQAGRITMDTIGGAGPTPAGFTPHIWPSAILQAILLDRGLLADDEFDFTFLDRVHAEESEFSQCGIYLRERANLLDVLGMFVGTLRLWYGFSRDGKLTGGVIKAPDSAAASVMTIAADDVAERGLQHTSRVVPATQVRVGWRKNWTVQDPDSLAGAVASADRATYSQPFYNIYTRVNAVPVDQHLTAIEPPLIETLLIIQGAQTSLTTGYGAVGEGLHYMGQSLPGGTYYEGLLSVERDYFDLETFASGFDVELGDTVTVQYPRYGFNDGVDVIVTGITLRLLESTTTLQIWK